MYFVMETKNIKCYMLQNFVDYHGLLIGNVISYRTYCNILYILSVAVLNKSHGVFKYILYLSYLPWNQIPINAK